MIPTVLCVMEECSCPTGSDTEHWMCTRREGGGHIQLDLITISYEGWCKSKSRQECASVDDNEDCHALLLSGLFRSFYVCMCMCVTENTHMYLYV